MEKNLNDQFKTEFARLLTTYRLKRNLSVRHLANSLNLTSNTIYEYQLGRRIPDSIKTVYSISQVLDIPLHTLLMAIYTDLSNQNKLEFLEQIPPLKTNFSLFLTKKRNEKNISQEELANLVGIPVEEIQGYESGKLKFDSIELAYKISNALDVSINCVINARLHNFKHSHINYNFKFASLAAKSLYVNRKQALLSQKKLAKLSGISAISIMDFEAENRQINSILTAMHLSVALGLPTFSLIEARCKDFEAKTN